MRECEHIGKCAFYNGQIKDMPETASIARRLYCYCMPENCRRNMRAKEFPVEDVLNMTFPIRADRFTSE